VPLIPKVLLIAVAGFLAGVLLAAVVNYSFAFFYAPVRVFPEYPQTRSFTGQKPPRGLAWAIARELWTGILFFGTYALWPFYRGVRLQPGQGLRPLILVHGYAVSRTSWFWFVRMLARNGLRRPVYALAYNWLAPVQTSSQALASLINTALTEQGATQVDVVAHSWGGFLARWCIQQRGMANRVRRLVMISTPCQGTLTTRFGIGAPRDQMSVGSTIVATLGAAPPSPPYATLWTDADEIVVPPQFSLIAQPGSNPLFAQRFHGISHLTMVRDSDVAALVAKLVSDAPWPFTPIQNVPAK
jgi:triacylglycerol esterase/lipase EstA (alpha/beta hydrolase family)